ncbi:MAG: tRNA(Met) cytidine acetyltransferase TmcA [Ignisphaera sp.]
MIKRDEIAGHLRNKNYKQFREHFLNELRKAIENRYRLLLILAGDDHRKQIIMLSDIVINFLRVFLSYRDYARMLYVYHDEFDDANLRKSVFNSLVKSYIKKKKINVKLELAVYENSDKYLGTTYQVLIMDLTNSLRPLDIGRLVGIVEGGGIVVLLVPKWDDWHNRKNLFQMSLTVPQHPEPRKVFVKWFKDITLNSPGIFIYDIDVDGIIKMDNINLNTSGRKEIKLPVGSRFPVELYKLALTQDQVEAVKILENFIDPPKKPFKRITAIYIADRGRGKSCAIGIGLAGLINALLEVKNKIRIAVTAPSLNNVQSLMLLAMKALDTIGLRYKKFEKNGMIYEIRGDKFSIEYWEPAVIPKLDVDIAVVDEAAGIPVPLLHKIWSRFRRTIFATTIHGYEGAGRGFSIRFLKRIREDRETNLMLFEMEEPIRYSNNDPVEKWQFRVLLLDAEPDELTEDDMKLIEEKRFVYLKLQPESLFTLENEKILKSLFGIYVLAHYRNEPDDLAMMADAPHHSIRALALENGKIVAAAQLAEEGPIPDEYIDSLLRGGKIPGNIIPDRLLKHGRIREIGSGKGWRIVRIAVHPSVQGRGIGSFLLNELAKEASERGYDWIGSGFGATSELLHFWIKNGFVPLHISPDRNPVSAEYTVLILKPLNDKWKHIVEIIYGEFVEKLIESMHDTYRDLEVDVAWQLLKAFKKTDINVCKEPSLTPIQLDRLLSYVEGYMTYESCCDVITIIIKHYWRSHESCRMLESAEEKLTILKTLQGLSWDQCASLLGAKKAKLLDDMRRIVSKILAHFFAINENNIDKLLGKVSLNDYTEKRGG